MKKSFMNNIKNFVDSNVRQRIDRAANNNNDFFGDDLLLLERQFEDLKYVCIEAEKRISALLQSLNYNSSTLVGTYTQNVQASLSNLTTTTTSPQPSSSGQIVMQNRETQPNKSKQLANTVSQNESKTMSNIISQNFNESTELSEDIKKHKKLPIVGFLRFLIKSNNKLKSDSLLATTFSQCSRLQTRLTKLYLSYEQTIELQCLKPIQQVLETDVPNIIKLRKIFIKSHNDLESVKAKYNGANQKHLQHQSIHPSSTSYTIAQSNTQQANANKVEQLKKELDEALCRFEQARDTYATELYAFVCKETELVNLFMEFYRYQAEYHQNVALTIQGSLPHLDSIYATTPRRPVFGTTLDEHLRHTRRSKSLVIDLCVHLLYANGLNEEGLFRIPGSSIKIKKLKNAINAWFITLASQNELEHDVQTLTSHTPNSVDCSASLLAIYNLFKDIAGQQPQQEHQPVSPICSDNNSQSTITMARDDSTLTANSSSPCFVNNTNQHLVFDLHTIAGLLKLYLRELPEPLFTHALYDQWLNTTVRTLNEQETEVSLEQLISKLPTTNYDNLRHVIRFLHRLTCHHGQNKMTATNLAIAMAPSLIWSRPQLVLNQSQDNQLFDCEQQQHNEQQQHLDEIHALNMQMSSVGLSASMHALVIENLIKNAERYFPGPIQFTMQNLINYEELTTTSSNVSKHDRFQKTASPTGLSTASSSSFSSSSSKTKQHSRKGGSMEGLLNDDSNIINGNRQIFSMNRPVSVNLSSHKIEITKQSHGDNNVPPPVPPAPLLRSHLRNTCDQLTHRTFSSHQKPPAPPPPPSTVTLLKRSNKDQPFKEIKSDEFQDDKSQTTTHIRTTNNSSNISLNATRPNVPPPSRPLKFGLLDDVNTNSNEDATSTSADKTKFDINFLDDKISKDGNNAFDNKSSYSLSSSDNLRTDFEEINADEISVSVSPVVSLNSISGGDDGDNDDSSFDNESQSLENSWAERQNNQDIATTKDISSKNNSNSPESSSNNKTSIKIKLDSSNSTNDVIDYPKPPVKPPRSTSPKQTQSTPL